jgi:hypothetical protein
MNVMGLFLLSSRMRKYSAYALLPCLGGREKTTKIFL